MGTDRALAVADDYGDIVIPHLVLSADELDTQYPSMVVPDGPYDDDAAVEHDKTDGILQAGLKIAQQIAEEAATFGRRREMPDDAAAQRVVREKAVVKLNSGEPVYKLHTATPILKDPAVQHDPLA
jgi:hypothetical protein